MGNQKQPSRRFKITLRDWRELLKSSQSNLIIENTLRSKKQREKLLNVKTGKENEKTLSTGLYVKKRLMKKISPEKRRSAGIVKRRKGSSIISAIVLIAVREFVSADVPPVTTLLVEIE
ncbi:MAG: hypothetical protein B7W96_00270 [Parcubacteria group bacterium 37-58-5]|nr:MAG: hypothetical protein B7X03_01350 [Parcubacteria group bacterium 21-58-10]OYV83223.1 MAG: hypothetical protein B7W96_00270 [Parcubacteria group bacterium 37-58-5]